MEVTTGDLPQEEIGRLVNEIIRKSFEELKETGIESTMRPLYGNWPLPQASET
jgi:hypothetical protein